ncbi:MAG TPA: 2-oxoacid:ferredoxin oxidoreductase subunit beta [bacterium]|nr:2-oxoacid:ferredoxin oxidoreductase subunit beta [bacterium]
MEGKAESAPKLTRKDFVSSQEVRWCPGCGDYAILAQVQKVMADLGFRRENYVIVSGIGCSSRMPYYVNAFGFHTIHGRAPAIATGVKVANPDLSVWVVTGDGDALSIGGNHSLHALRKNADLKILLFNNRIYGLTKGQYSPTSEFGKKTKSTPFGSVDYPLNPISFAAGAGATFIARTLASDPAHMGMVIEQAGRHRGSAFVEILQNCVIFNDDAYKELSDRLTRPDHVLQLEQGKPLLFGRERNRGIRLRELSPEVVTLGDGAVESDLLVHDSRRPNLNYTFLLSGMDPPEFPTPIGIFYQKENPTLDQMIHAQVTKARQALGEGDLMKVLTAGETWTVS